MEKSYIDKVAYIHITNRKVLVTLSKGKDMWYMPGGKREGNENDQQVLTREVKEELSVDLIPESIMYYGTFEAQAHGKPEGVIVKMSCYRAEFKGEVKPASEIEKMDYFDYSKKGLTAMVDHLIFDDLKANGLID